MIIGLIGLSRLPLEQFPTIAPPTVRVSASYPGANALRNLPDTSGAFLQGERKISIICIWGRYP
ncbi:MAG: efflux RND transporter permease subunit [Bacteroidales bacterium]|nr:efflux RND transporter permease subunit [Bacteroidales bacterium]